MDMVNLQDPRVLRTRQLIMESFRELLRSRGFESISVKDIAQKATINRATFYTHYEDKYALLEETIEQAFRGMIPEDVANAKEFTGEVCDQLILLTYRYIVDFYKICRMDSKSIAKIVDDKIKHLLQQTIENIFLKGNIHQMEVNHHLKIISAMTGSAIYGAAHCWLKDGEMDRADFLVNVVHSYVMNGIGLHLK